MFAGRCYHFIQSERLKLFHNEDSGIILLITFDFEMELLIKRFKIDLISSKI